MATTEVPRGGSASTVMQFVIGVLMVLLAGAIYLLLNPEQLVIKAGPVPRPTADVIAQPTTRPFPTARPAIVDQAAPAPPAAEPRPNVVPEVADPPALVQRENLSAAPPPPGLAPTAEPKVDGFGSKDTGAPPRPAEGQCLHGQVYFPGAGCKNPLK